MNAVIVLNSDPKTYRVPKLETLAEMLVLAIVAAGKTHYLWQNLQIELKNPVNS